MKNVFYLHHNGFLILAQRLHQKFPDGIVCMDDNYSCQCDITQ
jgi:hypothetical protein